MTKPYELLKDMPIAGQFVAIWLYDGALWSGTYKWHNGRLCEYCTDESSRYFNDWEPTDITHFTTNKDNLQFIPSPSKDIDTIVANETSKQMLNAPRNALFIYPEWRPKQFYESIRWKVCRQDIDLLSSESYRNFENVNRRYVVIDHMVKEREPNIGIKTVTREFPASGGWKK